MRVPLTIAAGLVVALGAYLSWSGSRAASVEPAAFARPAETPPPGARESDRAVLGALDVAALGTRPLAGSDEYPADTDHHVVRPGETLASIAYWRYGSRSSSRRIYQANRDQIENPDRIYPGQRLRLP